MAKFGSLWVGAPLSKVQIISLSSFIYHGHEMILFVYDMNLEVPDGVIKQDARQIMAEEDIFKVKDQYAAFSDLFRYRMIKETGLIWVDADTVCFSPDWNFKDNTFAGYERDTVVGGVLSLPQNSKALDYLIQKSSVFDKSKINWTDVGPDLVNKAFNKYNLMSYVQEHYVFCGIHWSEWEKLWKPEYLREIKILERKGKSLSLYNSMITRSGRDKNYLPRGSAIEYLYRKFVKREL